MPKRILTLPRDFPAVFMAVFLVFALGLVVFAFFLRAHDVSASDRRICREVERIKALIRAEARENYRNLNRNLRLLRIERTEAIADAARRERDARLRRFAPSDCSHLPSNVRGDP